MLLKGCEVPANAPFNWSRRGVPGSKSGAGEDPLVPGGTWRVAEFEFNYLIKKYKKVITLKIHFGFNRVQSALTLINK